MASYSGWRRTDKPTGTNRFGGNVPLTPEEEEEALRNAGQTPPPNVPKGKPGDQLPNSQPNTTPTGFKSPTGNTMNTNYRDPSQKPPPSKTTDGQEADHWWNPASGAWEFFKNNWGEILTIGGSVALGFLNHQDNQRAAEERKAESQMSSADRAKALEEQKREFDKNLEQRQTENTESTRRFERTTGNDEATRAADVEQRINRAPIADNAQALILARMGVSPGAFKPRDYTKGQASLTTPNDAPGANVASHMQAAAANYKPGDGKVDTTTLRMLLAKMKASGFAPPKPGEEPLPPPSHPVKDGPPPVVPTQTPPRPQLPPVTPITPPVEVQPRPTLQPDPDPLTDEEDPATALLRRRMAYVQ